MCDVSRMCKQQINRWRNKRILENDHCEEREADGRILKRVMQRRTYFHFMLEPTLRVSYTRSLRSEVK
jgi:hypothetical protein